ncbi:hypothetical protein CANTEDRAFT_111859 [Yamadazyma tenuis ATCC 10573]|nr:uncharacterized protein CANTEDRAFT_111859 [Yamadazyma tenuis ATCC 10573]EGV60055.1 hypothetical protein CANTEDRAFT_111859 [Yamadazyma tenuis ATCC 10573]
MVSIMVAAEPTLVERHSGILIEKYMTVLYANQHVPVDTETVRALVPEIKRQGDSLAIARQLYGGHLKRKTPSVIGRMLHGELQVQPQNIYKLYTNELRQNNITPDETCLAALIKGATDSPTNNPGACHIWDDMYAPQIAIHEFKSHVAANKTVASGAVWEKYIEMLAKYEYVSELSEIIRWWESTQFVPQYSTLLALLRALPIEFATRHIAHVEKVKRDSGTNGSKVAGVASTASVVDWPWPQVSDL